LDFYLIKTFNYISSITDAFILYLKLDYRITLNYPTEFIINVNSIPPFEGDVFDGGIIKKKGAEEIGIKN
jgi:hypothetical protein